MKKLRKIFFIIIVFILLVVLYVFASTRNETIKATANIHPSPVAKKSPVADDAAMLINKVGQLMELPIGEKPTIATVSDMTKLKGQPFFDKAENSDKVLIYKLAKKAILYRPSENKIINVAPVTGN
jgi:hypothetical protein